MWHLTRTWGFAAVFLVGVLSVGCGGNSGSIESPVSEGEAIEMAENALQGFNDGDYAAWSRDWSDAMKAAIAEEDFLAFRDQYHAVLGDYTSITNATGSEGVDPGTYRWTYEIEFENSPYVMWFGFKEGSQLIEGVSFEEPSG